MKTIVWFWFVLGALSAAGKVFQTKPGNKAILQCGVNSYASSLVWRHEDKLIISIDARGFSRKGTGDIIGRAKVKHPTDLEIFSVKQEDAGKFTCSADAHREDHTLLVVSVSISPSSTLNLGTQATLQCSVNGLSSSPTVQWERPDGEKHTGSELTSVNKTVEGPWQCTFTSDGVTYKEMLEIKVEVPLETTTTAPSLSKDPNAGPTSGAPQLPGLSWWVWVAIGVGCLVVVLLIVCVIVLCKRIKRRKREMQKMKNGRQLLKPTSYCECDCPTAAAKSQQGRRREKPSSLPLQPLLRE